MNEAQRKAWMIDRLNTGEFQNIHEAWVVVGEELNSLEAMPFGIKFLPHEAH